MLLRYGPLSAERSRALSGRHGFMDARTTRGYLLPRAVLFDGVSLSRPVRRFVYSPPTEMASETLNAHASPPSDPGKAGSASSTSSTGLTGSTGSTGLFSLIVRGLGCVNGDNENDSGQREP